MADILNPLVWNEIDANNNSAQMPSFPEFMPANQLNNAARAVMGAIKRWADQINATINSTGSATNYVLTYAVNPDALYAGQRFMWVPHIDSNASPNLNINALGNKRIRKVTGGAAVELVAGDIQLGFPVEVVYNVSGDQFILLNAPQALVNASETVYGSVKLATLEQVLESLPASNHLVTDVQTVSALWEIGANVTLAASTLTLAKGGHFHVSSAAAQNMTSIVFTQTSSKGRRFTLVFNDNNITIKNGPLLALPGGKDIAAKTNDVALFVYDTGDVFRLVSYQSSTIPAEYVDFTMTFPVAQAIQAHGLGAVPSRLSVALKCIVANLGYAANDVVYVQGTEVNAGAEAGFSLSADATNIYLSCTPTIFLMDKAGVGMSTITKAEWSVMVRAFK
jgi:hypothetical protein